MIKKGTLKCPSCLKPYAELKADLNDGDLILSANFRKLNGMLIDVGSRPECGSCGQQVPVAEMLGYNDKLQEINGYAEED